MYIDGWRNTLNICNYPCYRNQSWFKKRKKKPEQEEKTKSDYEKLVEGSKITKGMFAVHQKKNDYYFEIPTSLLGRDLLIVNKLQRVPAELNDAGVNRGVNYETKWLVWNGTRQPAN